jgi:mannose-6-phosphate isomerase-like protein (cupin superfamily)
MNELRRPRRVVQPRELKKSSQRRKAALSPVKVAGQREPTETGYIVPGYIGKTFETFFEVMLAGSASAFLLHEKKDRAIWVIAGTGFVTTQKKGEKQTTRRLITGDTVSFDRNTTYRIATTASEQLEFFVTQSAKYDATLQIVAPSDAPREATEAELIEPTLEERLGTIGTAVPTRRRGSKAAQQQARTHRKSRQVEETFKIVPESGAPAADPRRAGTPTGVNVQPSGGRFDESGAG